MAPGHSHGSIYDLLFIIIKINTMDKTSNLDTGEKIIVTIAVKDNAYIGVI